MSRKSKNISIILLSAMLVSCKSTSVSNSSKPSINSPSQSDVSTKPSLPSTTTSSAKPSTSTTGSSSQEEVDPASIRITNTFKELKLGEVVTIEAEILPQNAKKSFTLSTEDENYIQILEDHKIRAIKKTPLGKKVSVIATTENGLESVLRFTVSEKSVNQGEIDSIVSKLKKSRDLSVDYLSSGELHINLDEKGQPSQIGDYEYVVYDGGLHSEVKKTAVENGKQSQTISSRLIKGSRYLKGNASLVDGKWVGNTTTFDSKTIADTPSSRYETTLQDAKKEVASVSIEGYSGLEGFIINEYLTNYESFGNSLAMTYLEIEKPNDTDYKLSYDYVMTDSEGSLGFTESLELYFDTLGKLESIELHGGYYDPSDTNKTLIGSLDVSGEQKYETRKADTDPMFDFSSYFYSDFGCYFTDSITYDVTIPARLDYYVGESIYMKLDDTLSKPATASSKLDSIEIESVSDPEVLEINTYRNSMKAKKAGTCKVTVKSSINQVSKTYDFTITEPKVTEINWGNYYSKNYLASAMISSFSKEIVIDALPKSNNLSNKPLCSPVISSVTSSDPNVLSVVKKEDGSSFTVTAKKVNEKKSVTVTVIEETLGESKPLTKEVSVYPYTDQGIAQMLSEQKIYAMNQSFFPNAFVFTLNEDKVSGVVTLDVPAGNKKDESALMAAKGNFKVENKTIKTTMTDDFFSVSTFQFRDVSRNCNQFDFDFYYSVDQSYFYGSESDSTTGEPLLGSAYCI